ncbi:Wall-associated receptor kinase 5 [Abeliophyllum distichum]|uniref:Wall-associated receptor kinase 5 n=1 Tax=Abeliophyllum distichum TaxID=126358 RepID=A0ABD1VPD3_9LAMI
MFLNIFFLLSLTVAPPSKATGATTNTFTKPGCQSKCGNLPVPYQFGIGIGSNCSICSPRFDISCNTSFNPPEPNLANTKSHPSVVMTWLLYKEYQKTSNFGSGCVSFSSSPDDFSGIGFCPGNGCCQTSIPNGTNVLHASLSYLHNNWRKSKLFPCSLAFVGTEGSFNFCLSDLNDPTILLKNSMILIQRMPLVLDWRIGSQNCTVIQNSTNYACQKNSFCIDFYAGVGGYRCRCSEGYEDINECNSDPCHKMAICTNTPGSYHCACRLGYYGTGAKDDFGCLPTRIGEVPEQHRSNQLCRGNGTTTTINLSLVA